MRGLPLLLLLALALALHLHPVNGRSKRKRKQQDAGSGIERTLTGVGTKVTDLQIGAVLKATGVTRGQYDRVVEICHLHLAEEDWDSRHAVPYDEMQLLIARDIVQQGPEAVHKFMNDDQGSAGLWSNAAIKVQNYDLYYQWGPTRPDPHGTPEPFPDEIRRIPAKDLSYEKLLEIWDGSKPTMLTGVEYPALNWTKDWLTEVVGDQKVKIQMRVPGPKWAQTGTNEHFYQIDTLKSFTSVVGHSMGVKWCALSHSALSATLRSPPIHTVAS